MEIIRYTSKRIHKSFLWQIHKENIWYVGGLLYVSIKVAMRGKINNPNYFVVYLTHAYETRNGIKLYFI